MPDSVLECPIEIEPGRIRIGKEWAFAYSEVRGLATSKSAPDTVTVDVKQSVIYHRTPAGWRISQMMVNPNG